MTSSNGWIENPAHARLVHAEKIKALYSKGLFALIIGLVNPAILMATLWSVFPHSRTLVWMGSLYAIVGIRLIVWRRHRCRLKAEKYDAQRWERRWMVGASVTGLWWGLAGVFFYSPPNSGHHYYLVLFLIGGMIAGASASMSSYFPAFLSFTIPALVPSLVRLSLSNDKGHLVVVALLISFGFGMSIVAWIGSQSIHRSISLRFANVSLVEDLTTTQKALTQLNAELETRIETRTDELKQAVAERDRFVSVVSHELRTPLSSMILNVDLLRRYINRGPVAETASLQRYLDVLGVQADRMRRLVDDLLDLSRLSMQRIKYNKVRTELKTVIEEMLEKMAPQLAAGSSEKNFTAKLDSGLIGGWDPGRLQQVFINLISNAIRYGAPPYALTAYREGAYAQVVVSDHGRGIRPEALSRIFQAFESAHSGASAQGLGLGLYIAAEIVRAHQGTIRVESTSQGTAFIVQLPLM